MATLVLVTGTDPAALLEAAAADFLVPRAGTPDDPFPSPRTFLALRQGGLRDDLLRLAAARGVPGWFDPPLCVFAELGRRLAPDLARAVDPVERLVLLEEALRTTATRILGRADRLVLTLRETDALLGELLAEGVTPDAFEAAVASLPSRDAHQARRDAELLATWRTYAAALAARGRRDGRDTLAGIADAVSREPDALARALGGRRTMHVVGLMDLRGGWRPLLRALRASPVLDRVALHTMHASLLEGAEGLAPDAVVATAPHAIADRLFRRSPAPGESGDVTPSLARLDVPDDRRGIEHVAVRVRALLDAGTPPHRIAVVAREARPFTDRAAATFARLGIPVSVRRRVALREVPVLRLVRQLLEAAGDEWQRHALVELAEHPLMPPGLDALVLNRLGYATRLRGLEAWREALDTLVARGEARDAGADPRDDDERRHPLPPTPRLAAARDGFAAFAVRVRDFDGARPLAAWVEALHAFVRDDPWGLGTRLRTIPGDDVRDVRPDVLGWDLLARTLRAWAAALAGRDGVPLDAAAVVRELDAVLDGDVVLPADSVHGVIVAEGLAVAYREVDHLFILGLEAGRFPRARRPGVVLDDAERDALVRAGIPLDRREQWEGRERELFRALVASASRSCTLVSSRASDGGGDAVVSAFVGDLARTLGSVLPTTIVPSSDVVAAGLPLVADDAARANAVHGAEIERARLDGVASPYDGRIDAPALQRWLASRHDESFEWSPTQLESLAKCPHAWFAQRLLRLERLEDPDDDVAGTVRGRVLHGALARFYDALVLERRGPVLLRVAELDALWPRLDAAFDAAYAEAQESEWMGEPALEDARRDEWRRILRRFVEREAVLRDKWLHPTHWAHKRHLHTGVLAHERRFGPLPLEIDGVRLRVRGTIDRIEVGIDDRVDDPAHYRSIVDYKSSASACPGGGKGAAWRDGIVLQAPLYAAALAALEPDVTIARVEYLNLRDAQPVLPLRVTEVSHRTGMPESGKGADEQLAASRAGVAAAVRRAREGDFPAEPAPSAGCPTWCVAFDTCRVAGGPRVRSW